MMEGIGFGTYIFFACFCFLAAVFAYFFVPELAGKSLEEMDGVFNDNQGVVEQEVKRRISVSGNEKL